MKQETTKSVLLIVAHPDDETLWVGGTILSNPTWKCFVVCLCRGDDPNREPRFRKALKALGVIGVIGDLDDGPDQNPLKESVVEQDILNLLPTQCFDLVITHSPKGEYTKHLRHEEVGQAVLALWSKGALLTGELWCFAYEDGQRTYYPRPIKTATIFARLSKSIWQMKYNIITNIYGFVEDDWEAKTTPKAEAFWQFYKPAVAKYWQFNDEINLEG